MVNNEKYLEFLDLLQQNKFNKIEMFDLLSEFTYDFYSENLGDIKTVFPYPITTIEKWKNYVRIKESNIGKEIEQCIENYAKKQGLDSSLIRGKGKDVFINGKELEVKSSEKEIINTKLQTSFYQNNPNKFYCFVTNTKHENIQIRIVSSQLLYEISLGNKIISEIKETKNSTTLTSQIEKGLNQLNFVEIIKTALLTGESSDVSKSFEIGNGVKIRFLIFIEPK